MNLEEFDRGIGQIWLHLGASNQRRPGPQQVDCWFSECRDVDSPAVPWIVQRIKREMDNVPRNPSKVFVALWYQWKNLNADKLPDPNPRRFCHECLGEGMLFVGKSGPTGEIQISYACRACDNWRRHVSSDFPRIYRRDIERIPGARDLHPLVDHGAEAGRRKVGNVALIAEQVGARIPGKTNGEPRGLTIGAQGIGR